MAEILKIKGEVISAGDAKGSALVSPVNFSFFGGVDPANGVCNDPHSVLYNESVVGKVMVYRAGKSSTANCTFMYTMALRKIAPAGIITSKLDSIQVMGAICGEIPLVRVDDEINGLPMNEFFRTGDMIEIIADPKTDDADSNDSCTIVITRE